MKTIFETITFLVLLLFETTLQNLSEDSSSLKYQGNVGDEQLQASTTRGYGSKTDGNLYRGG